MLDFLLMIRVKLPFVNRIHPQSNNVVTVWRTTLLVTQNLMTVLTLPFQKIHTLPQKGIGISWGWGGRSWKNAFLRRSMDIFWNYMYTLYLNCCERLVQDFNFTKSFAKIKKHLPVNNLVFHLKSQTKTSSR